MPNNNPAKLANLKMPDYSGSWWQQYPSVLTTLPIGKWTPCGVYDIPANSFVRIKPKMRYEGLPQLSPLYGGWTQRTKYLFVPYRLYIPQLRKNRNMNWSAIPKLSLPKLKYIVDYSSMTDDQIVNGHPRPAISMCGSLLDRLNMAYGELFSSNSFNNVTYIPNLSVDANKGTNAKYEYTMNMLPLLAYVDSWLYTEFNPQDRNIPVDNDYLMISGDGIAQRSVSVSWVDYQNLQKFITAFAFNETINWATPNVNTYTLPKKSAHEFKFSYDYNTIVNTYGNQSRFPVELVPNYPIFTTLDGSYVDGVFGFVDLLKNNWDSIVNNSSTVGLLPVTYKGDYFTSWFNSDAIVNAQKFVVTNNESLLSLRKKNSDMLLSLLSMMSGERFVDYAYWVFDTELELKDHPIVIGYDELDFGGVDIISNAETSEGPQNVGSTSILGGTAQKVRDFNRTVKPLTVKTKEPGLIMVCSSIVPNVYYYQGTHRWMNYSVVADLWHPQYQKMGFTQVRKGEFFNPFATNSVSFSGDIVDIPSPSVALNTGVGYVPLGWEYMRRFNELQGSMKLPMFKTWSLHRDFQNSFSRYNEGFSNGYDPVEYENPFYINLSRLKSTYVDGGAYNYMFQNTSRADSSNFIVRFEYDMSIYQPLAHTLIDKQAV